MLREIDLKDVFPADWQAGPRLEDHALIPSKKSDWLHLNAIDYNSEESVIVLSGRNQNAVFALDYDSGELAWLFSDPEGLGSSDSAEYHPAVFPPLLAIVTIRHSTMLSWMASVYCFLITLR